MNCPYCNCKISIDKVEVAYSADLRLFDLWIAYCEDNYCQFDIVMAEYQHELEEKLTQLTGRHRDS